MLVVNCDDVDEIEIESDNNMDNYPIYGWTKYKATGIWVILRVLLNNLTSNNAMGNIMFAEVATFVYATDPEGNIVELQNWGNLIINMEILHA